MKMHKEKLIALLYDEVHSTDEVSLRLFMITLLLLFVGLMFSMGCLYFNKNHIIYLISLYGAVITFAIFRWEYRNLQIGYKTIEKLMSLQQVHEGTSRLKIRLYDKIMAPQLFGIPFSKGLSEKIIYFCTIILWLILPLWLTYPDNFMGLKMTSAKWYEIFYYVSAIIIIGIAFITINSKIYILKNPETMHHPRPLDRR